MKKLLTVLLTLSLLLSVLPAAVMAEDTVTINYWQYYYESKVDLMDELIPAFEAANPGIKVVQTHFPYESYEEKLAAAISSPGETPDIVNLFYGWV